MQAQLGAALVTRYRATADPADFDEARALLSEAAAVTIADADSAAVVSAALSEALYMQFAVSGDPAVLDETIDAARCATAHTVQGLPDLAAGTLTILGAALRDRAELHWSEEDLAEAVDVQERAVRVALPGSQVRVTCLTNLGNALLSRFYQTGQATDLDIAIDVITQADALTPDGSISKSPLGGLRARSLLARFEMVGSERDLDMALALSRQACDMLPPAHPDRASHLSFAAGASLVKYQQTEELDDLNASVEDSQQALAAVPPGHINTLVYQFILAASLRMRFVATGNDADIDEASALARDSLASVPANHTLLPHMLADLGSTMLARFMATENRADFHEAVDWLRRAAAAAQGRTGEADIVVRLAVAFGEAYECYGSHEYRDEAISLYQQAIRLSASPTFQITAARLGANQAADFAPGVAADFLETAVRLLPVAVSRQLSRADQQRALRQYAFLSNEAAELALIVGGPAAPARALGLLELSRAVLQGQALDSRRDLLDLYAAHPALAQRFRDLCTLLDTPDEPHTAVLAAPADAAAGFIGVPAAAIRAVTLASPATGGVGATDTRVVRRTDLTADQASDGPDRFRAGAEFAALLDQIRDLASFESFLLPPTPADLTQHAAQGPIVAFNIGQSRCDALIVTSTEIAHVPLPALEGEALASRIDLWEESLELLVSRDADINGRILAEGTLNSILEWLWDVVTEPVLGHLGYAATPEPGQPWPRVWWAPGGFLGMLPLHAAGYHRTPTGASVLDRVVSSYVPTVRAVAYARERSRNTPPTSALIVAMPTTPGLDDLSIVAAETATLERLLPSPTVLIESEDSVDDRTPTRERVLAALEHVGIAHFSCHAASYADDPSRSQIYLHDHQTNPFTVATLMPTRLPHAQLAFLSACQTASNGDLDLLDEAIHLTTAFQQAGFPHVIGTMWTVLDTDAIEIAEKFYLRLQTEQHTLVVAESAHALHHAVRSMRYLHPSRWAAFIHVGA